MNISMTPRHPRAAFLIAVATLALSTLSASPAHADARAQPLGDQTIAALSSAVDPTTRTFNGAEARAGGASASAVRDFATGWTIAGGRTVDAVTDTALIEEVATSTPVVRACAGQNRWDYTGIQLNVYLNSCNTTRVIGAIAAGAGGATLVGIITAATGVGATVGGVIAAGLAVAGGVLTSCSAKGRGIAVHNIPPGPIVWCNGQ